MTRVRSRQQKKTRNYSFLGKKETNEMKGGPRSVARRMLHDIKSDENIIKLKVVVLNTIINNVKINYWDRGK
jgi:hypothetical protein